MDINPISLIVGIAGPLVGLVIALLGLRKVRAEARQMETQGDVNEAEEADTFAEAITKLTANNSALQADNRKLYQEIVAFEKKVADCELARQNLGESRQAVIDRLAERDHQIATLNEQLRLLQDRERQSDITKALSSQLQAITEIRQSYERILAERERMIKDLVARTGPLPPLPARQQNTKKGDTP
jgi:predicted DNA-binding protein YlxM (UPF0122 family)